MRIATAVKALLFVGLIGLTGWSFGLARRAVPQEARAESGPALSAMQVILGSSRGFLCELLWWRIDELQRQNRLAEMLPMTELLVSLDPSSADVWVFNAWNMAYNISDIFESPESKWLWVKRSVELLERGLAQCPATQQEQILRQLGWTYEDKIGGTNDPAAPFYRARITELGRPQGAAEFERATGAILDWTHARTYALYWYWRSGRTYDQLRATVALLRATNNHTLTGFFAKVLEAERDDIPQTQFQSLEAYLKTLQTSAKEIRP